MRYRERVNDQKHSVCPSVIAESGNRSFLFSFEAATTLDLTSFFKDLRKGELNLANGEKGLLSNERKVLFPRYACARFRKGQQAN